MDFVCTLEWLGGSKGAVLSKAVLELHKASYFIHSQKREDSNSGKVFVHLSASSRGKENIKDVTERIETLQDFKLVNAVQGNSLDLLDLALDRKEALAKISTAFPNIVTVVQQFTNSLVDAEYDSALYSLGQSVGGGVYKRDYSLGSPLPLDKTLTRELSRALKPFSVMTIEGNTVSLKQSPFGANSASEKSNNAFIAGFIHGFLAKNPVVDVQQVNTIKDESPSSKHCTFEIIE